MVYFTYFPTITIKINHSRIGKYTIPMDPMGKINKKHIVVSWEECRPHRKATVFWKPLSEWETPSDLHLKGSNMAEQKLAVSEMWMQFHRTMPFSLSQWLNFKLSGITCLVGKIKFELLSQGPLAE